MFSIGEFSKASGLSVKTLRFYHERGLLVPAATDERSGYRYYDGRNLEKAGVIRALRKFEFSLEEIAAILEDCDDDQDAAEYLQRQRKILEGKSRHYRDLVQRIDQVMQLQREAREIVVFNRESQEIEERFVQPQIVAGLRIKGRYQDCGKVFSKLAKRVGRHISGKPLCLYYDGEYREEDADFEPCFPLRKSVAVNEFDVRTLPGAACVILLHRGPYDTLGESYARVFEYAKHKGYEIELPTREVYLKGPGMIFRGNPKKYLTEIQVPIRQET